MADLLDTLGHGALTVGKTALAIPQAVGGGALDILIGDRTNVPAGEQVKRSIEALLLAGDNPGNLVGIHAMNAKRDAANQAIVGSPDFQDFLRRAQDHGAAPMEAYTAAAKLYGVHGYAPTTETAHVPDLSVGPPTMGPQQETRPLTVPILPPPAATDVIKHVDALTALDALSRVGPEGEAARAAHADVPLPMGIPQALADETLKRLRQSEAFLTHETGVKIDGRGNVILDYQERKLPLFPEGVSRVPGYDRFREVPTPYPNIVTVEPDPAVDARNAAAAGVVGKAAGTITTVPGDTRTPAEIEQQQLADKYTAQLQYERDKEALTGSVPTTVARTAAVQTAKEADQLTGMINEYVAALKPGNIGAVGDLRQLQYGIAAQQKGFAALQQGVMDSMAENNLRPGTGKGIEGITGYFDPSLSTVQVLGNTIAYRIARILDPTGKLSDADVANQKRALGLDRWFGNEQDIAARMRVMQGFAQTQKSAAQGLLQQQPVAPSRPLRTVPMGGGRRVPSAAESNLNRAFLR